MAAIFPWPPPTYRNLLEHSTAVFIPCFLWGEGWGPATIEVPWEVPWRLGGLKEPSGYECRPSPAFCHIPVSSVRPETCVTSRILLCLLPAVWMYTDNS